MADTGRCPDCDRFTSGDCGKHGPRVEIFTVGPVCIVPCPGCGYAGSGAHVCLRRASLYEAEIARLRAELARERTMRASTGCACPQPGPWPHDVLTTADGECVVGHAAGCPAMEGGRLRDERDLYRAQASTFFDEGARKGAEANHYKAVARAMREAAGASVPRVGNPGRGAAEHVARAVEAAFREPPKGTDGR